MGDVEVLAIDGGDAATAMAHGGLPATLSVATAARITARLVGAVARRVHAWDALVTHWLVPCGLIGMLAARSRYHLTIAHGSDVALLHRLPAGRALAKRLGRRSDLVYVAESLRIDGAPGRVISMPPEHEVEAITPTERARARRDLGLGSERVALFLGRLVPEKGLDLLLEALPANVRLLVAGDGPERARLEGRSSQATFLGPRFGADKRALFAAADVLVVPSRRDGSPTVVAEARQLGVPVLATRVGGLPAAVGERGIVCDPTPAALSAALHHLMMEPRSFGSTSTVRGWEEVGPELWRGPRESHDNNARRTPRLDVFRYASTGK